MGMFHGGRAVARAIKAEGITHIFTLCGGHVMAIYDGAHDEGIGTVDFRHEQSAAHAADGWARSTGKPGIAVVTAGPGVTDAVTAVANAWRANVPMVLIGGQGPRSLQDMGSLQDMNCVDLMRPITKWSSSVPEPRRIPEYMAMAFRAATAGVPGPVFLEIPVDFLMAPLKEDSLRFPEKYRTTAKTAGDPGAIAQAAELLAAAEKPMLIVGSQWFWSDKRGALPEFLADNPMPTFLNGMARGALPPDNACFFSRTRKNALKGADVVLIFGTPLDFRLSYGRTGTFNKDCKLIHVDLDGNIIGHNRGADVGIVGDTGLVLEALTKALGGKGGKDTKAWLAEIAQAETEARAKMEPELTSNDTPINPLRVCHELNQFITDDTIVVGDGGDFVATAAYTLKVRGAGHWMDPGPLGTLGVGPGYAMAAKLAHPNKDVVIVYGDGSFGLNGFEFEAMARQNIKVVGVIGNDAGWTQILRGQRDMYGKDRLFATTLDYTRYDKVAEGMGCHGEWVEKPEEIAPALKRAFESPKPAIVNVKIGSSDFRKGAISI